MDTGSIYILGRYVYMYIYIYVYTFLYEYMFIYIYIYIHMYSERDGQRDSFVFPIGHFPTVPIIGIYQPSVLNYWCPREKQHTSCM